MVLSLSEKLLSDAAYVTNVSKVFHILGAATANAREYTVDSLTCGTTRRSVSSARRHLRVGR